MSNLVESPFRFYSTTPGLENKAEGLKIEFKNLGEAFQKIAEEFPESIALSYLGKDISYSKLNLESDQFAAGLNRLGYRKGDHIGISLPNIPQYFVVLLACFKLGAVAVNLSPLLTAREFQKAAETTEIKAWITFQDCFVGKQDCLNELPKINYSILTHPIEVLHPIKQFLAKKVKKVPFPKVNYSENILEYKSLLSSKDYKTDAIHLEDTAVIQGTGGTTGEQKFVELSHENLFSNVAQAIDRTEPKLNSETGMSILPMFHMAGMIGALSSLLIAGRWILIANPRDLDWVLKDWKKYSPNLFFAVPIFYEKLLERKEFHQLDFSALDFCGSGAAAISEKTRNKLKEVVGDKIMEGYGMTEASPGISCRLPDDGNEESVGKPFSWTEIMVLDSDDPTKVLPANEVGELFVRGPQVMNSYLGDSEATENAFFVDDKNQKWLKTGDLVTVNEQGFITIVDRKKEMVNINGQKVFPREIEELVTSFPGVFRNAVIGEIDHESKAECIVLYLELEDKKRSQTKLEEEILSFCKENLTYYKVPKKVRFLEEIPVTPIGKVDKKQLRKMGTEYRKAS